MTLRITDQEFLLLRNLIHQKSGIFLTENKKYLIENRLSALTTENGCRTFGELYLKLKHSSSSKSLHNAVIDAITTNETLWLRDKQPFTVLKECLYPAFFKKKQERKISNLNIWSAACSTGQEPYSIAITAHDFFNRLNKDLNISIPVKILATDISNAALSQAKKGEYNSSEINRGMSSGFLHTYFHQNSKKWIINNQIKQMVVFRNINLREPFIGTIGPFDIVFLRNVLIYFSDAFKKELFRNIARVLSPCGYLFLGTGETANGYSTAFKMIEHEKAKYYILNKNQ